MGEQVTDWTIMELQGTWQASELDKLSCHTTYPTPSDSGRALQALSQAAEHKKANEKTDQGNQSNRAIVGMKCENLSMNERWRRSFRGDERGDLSLLQERKMPRKRKVGRGVTCRSPMSYLRKGLTD
jgi:protoporphyrinogen oxidase